MVKFQILEKPNSRQNKLDKIIFKKEKYKALKLITTKKQAFLKKSAQKSSSYARQTSSFKLQWDGK